MYLPDGVGREAKEAGLPFSELLRAAVLDELERRRVVAETLDGVQEYEVVFTDVEERPVTGRLRGKLIAATDDRDVEVFLTEDRAGDRLRRREARVLRVGGPRGRSPRVAARGCVRRSDARAWAEARHRHLAAASQYGT